MCPHHPYPRSDSECTFSDCYETLRGDGTAPLWKVHIHARRGLDSWPTPLEVVAGRVQGGITRAGDSPNLRLRPHCSWVLTVGGEVVVRQGGSEATLRTGEAFLCRYPDPSHTHHVPANCPYWHNLFLDWIGSEEEVDELRARSPLGVRWPTASRSVGRLQELLARPGGLVELRPEHGAVLVRELLAEFFRAGMPTESRPRAWERLVQDALRLIHSRAESGMNVSDLARALDVSAEHLSRVFRLHLGQAPNVYLRRERLHAACALLESEDLTCAQVSERLGYSTPGTFTRSFQSVYGITPGQFRANCRLA